MTDDLIERVARARWARKSPDTSWGYTTEYIRNRLYEEVRADLADLRPGDELGEGLWVVPYTRNPKGERSTAIDYLLTSMREDAARQAAEAMRERCAQFAERWAEEHCNSPTVRKLAAAIRALEPEAGE